MCVSGSLNGFKNRLVKFRLGSLHLDLHLFATGHREITHHARKFGPRILNRLHASLHHPFLQLGGDEIQTLRGGDQGGIFRRAAVLQNLIASQHQFTDEIHQLVKQCDVDSYGRVADGL